ncbi:MAG: nucleotidyl transferase AbiEii/AbiGii toxin family protein [Spirochaetaceae bacterium]
MSADAAFEKTLEVAEAARELWIGRRLASGEFENEKSARSAFSRQMRAMKDRAAGDRLQDETMDLVTAVTALAKAARERGETLLLAGGFAYGVHVEPRATVDIDLIIGGAGSADSIEAAMRAVFDSVYVNQRTMDYTRVRVRRYLGITAAEETVIDALEPVSSAFSRHIAERAMPIDFKGVRLEVVSREDLYLLKSASAREQDRLDAVRLSETPVFDWDYVNDMEQLLQ